jgi:aminoglycoside 3-N-acetyltransferase
MNIKKIFRKILGVRENENISDALVRKRIKIEKLIYKTKFNTAELETIIRDCGICSGDNVLVHCSWRNMYNYDGSPEDIIKMLKELVGTEGTILMPCYGSDRSRFDVDNTPSSAGVLSEVFRHQKGVMRSNCTHFSVAGFGKNASVLLEEHINSKYGFDECSPCYKLGKYSNGKVLFLGLGSEPTKISIFHCAGAYLREKDQKLGKLLSYEYESNLIINGITYKKKMYIRQPGHKNNNASFKKIFRHIEDKQVKKISNLDIVVINAHEAIHQAISFAEKGVYCYKGMSRI